jgi:hypothetical protein
VEDRRAAAIDRYGGAPSTRLSRHRGRPVDKSEPATIGRRRSAAPRSRSGAASSSNPIREIRMRKMVAGSILVLGAFSLFALTGAPAAGGDSDVTRIHLVEKKGFFEVKETLMNLEPGNYVFEVKNEAGKTVGFMVQDLKTEETLAMGPIEPGKTKEYAVEISQNGFRYRCPINPTPWYEVSVGKM